MSRPHGAPQAPQLLLRDARKVRNHSYAFILGGPARACDSIGGRKAHALKTTKAADIA